MHVVFRLLRRLWVLCGSPFPQLVRGFRHGSLARVWPAAPGARTTQEKLVLPKNSEERQNMLIAPRGTGDCSPRWEGRIHKKPWEYAVTAVIPHLETPELLATCIELLRLQTERPYILIIDTGSSVGVRKEIEKLRAEDVEIHYILSHAYYHTSEPVAHAQDLALALCQSEYQFCTHADCFLRRRDYIEWLKTLCNEQTPAVGYQMSPRDWLTNQWEGMVSHTATLLHIPTLRKLGASWNMQRARLQFGIGNDVIGWPDTETCLNLVLQEAGVQPLLIGNETNYQRHIDENVDHCRSYTSAQFYNAPHYLKACSWVQDALREGKQRIVEWKKLQMTEPSRVAAAGPPAGRTGAKTAPVAVPAQ